MLDNQKGARLRTDGGRTGPSRRVRREPRQARKGAAAATDSGAEARLVRRLLQLRTCGLPQVGRPRGGGGVGHGAGKLAAHGGERHGDRTARWPVRGARSTPRRQWAVIGVGSSSLSSATAGSWSPRKVWARARRGFGVFPLRHWSPQVVDPQVSAPLPTPVAYALANASMDDEPVTLAMQRRSRNASAVLKKGALSSAPWIVSQSAALATFAL